MAYRLGIDLGTSTLMAAALRPGAAAALVVLGDGRPEASVVDVRDPGLGDEQATAALLRLARDRAAEQLGEPPDEVVLAVPGWWGDVQRAAFDAAVEAAELGPVRRIDQAEAAALGYAAQVLVPLGARIAVFDLGAASCAAAVLERVSAGFTVLASTGAEHPCGNDFDEAVSRLVAGGLGGARDAGDPARAAAIRRACTTAREALSTQSRVEVSVPGAAGSVPLSRTEVEGLIRGPIRTGLELIDQVLRDAGLAPADLTALVGVGGCCRTPIVRTLLGKEFAAPVAVSDRPEFAVAIGSVGDADTCLTATPKPPVEVQPAAAAGAAPVEAASAPIGGPSAGAATPIVPPPRQPVGPGATAPMPVTPHSAPPAASSPPPRPQVPPGAPPPRPPVPPPPPPAPPAPPPPVPPPVPPAPPAPATWNGPSAPAAWNGPPAAPAAWNGSPGPAAWNGPSAPGAWNGPPAPAAWTPPASTSPAAVPSAEPSPPPAGAVPTAASAPAAWTGQPAPGWQQPGNEPGGPPPAGRAAPRRSPRNLLIAGGAVLVAAVLGVLAFLQWGGETARTPATPAPTTPSPVQTPTTTPSESPTPLDGSGRILAGLPRADALPEQIVLVPMRPKGASSERLYQVDARGGGKPVPLKVPAGSASNPMMQPERATILYLHGGKLRAMASNGSGDRQLWSRQPTGCQKILHASWNRLSPTRLLISCQTKASAGALMSVGLDGTVIRTLRTAGARVGDFSVSPDGRTVAYWASDQPKASGGRLYTQDVEGTGAATPLTPAKSVDAHPVWSPDGATISFSRRVAAAGKVAANWDVYTMDRDGSNPKPLATGPTDDFKAVWSQDGRQLLLITNRVSAKGGPGSSYDLWLVGLDRQPAPKGLGLNAQRITRPFWSLR